MNSVSLAIPYLYLVHITIVSVRVGSALLFAPIWGYPGIPHYLRILLVFALAVGVAAVTPFSEPAYANPGLVLPTEFAIGLLLSMGVRIAFAGLHMGGQLVSFHLGFSAVQAIDPGTMNRSTLMAGFFTIVGYVVLLTMNQHHQMLQALAASYQVFPVGSSIASGQWFETLVDSAKHIFIIGWKISLPVFVATFMIEVVVGFIARMQPQVNTMVMAAPLKIILGLVILGASLAFLPGVLSSAVGVMISR